MHKRTYPFFKSVALGEKGKNLFYFLITLIPNAIAALFEGVSFGLILLALKALNGSLDGDGIPYWAISWVPQLPSEQMFVLFIILGVFAQVMRSILSYVGRISMLMLGIQIQNSAQIQVYTQILRFSFPFVNRYKTGDLLEYARIPSTLVTAFMDPINQTIISGFTILASAAMMLFISPLLALLAVATFSLFALSQKFIISKIARMSTSLASFMADFSKHTVQSLHAIRPIHIFCRQTTVIQHISENLNKIARMTKKLNFWSQSIQPINETVGICLVGLFLFLGQWVMPGKQVLPMLLTVIMIIHRVNMRVQVFLHSLSLIATHWGQVCRLEEILEKRGKEFAFEGERKIGSFSKAIVLKDITLHYPNTLYPAVQSLNLEILSGTTIALVGASGAGKSSILDLLLGLYQPSRGSITVDGGKIQDLNMEAWRGQFGVVSQDTFIFNDSIADNIRFGKLDATQTEIERAAALAGAHPFIVRLPNGYQTVVGERGYCLSGGERQRIALARALVRDPKILIFDEATSNLDSHSERLIQEALIKIRGKKTVILVAHRLSTVLHADRIFVLEKGRLIEEGSHTELLAKKGQYAFLWDIQAKKLEDVEAYEMRT